MDWIKYYIFCADKIKSPKYDGFFTNMNLYEWKNTKTEEKKNRRKKFKEKKKQKEQSKQILRVLYLHRNTIKTIIVILIVI